VERRGTPGIGNQRRLSHWAPGLVRPSDSLRSCTGETLKNRSRHPSDLLGRFKFRRRTRRKASIPTWLMTGSNGSSRFVSGARLVSWRAMATVVPGSVTRAAPGKSPGHTIVSARRFWSVHLLVTLPHAPGLSHSSPADIYYICVSLDWVIHQRGFGLQHRFGALP
jgi:hypothetical protein